MTIPTPPSLFRRFVQTIASSRVGRQVLPYLHPSPVWVVIFMIGGIAITVWTLTIYRAQTQESAVRARAQIKQEAIREAEIHANAESRYQACLGSIPQLRKIDAFIEGNQEGWHILIQNSQSNRDLAEPGSPLRQQRQANLDRIAKASRKIDRAIPFPIPTKDDCLALHERLLAQGDEKGPTGPSGPTGEGGP